MSHSELKSESQLVGRAGGVDRWRRASWPTAIVIGGAVFVMAAIHSASMYVPNTWINRDGRSYTNVNVTLIEDLSLNQQRFAASWYTGKLGWNHDLDTGWSNVAVGRGGQSYPKHPILLPLFSTPFFWAFGILGTLVFNLLMYGVMAGAGFMFVRAFASRVASTVSVVGFLFATALRDYIYDYHVDVLLLALFLSSIAAFYSKRHMLAGVLFGLVVVLKPTSLIWVPSMALLAVDRRMAKGLPWAMLGGLMVGVCAGCVNAWMFGRPWWTGYSRTLVVVGGHPQIADHADIFSVPWHEGLRREWMGTWGLRDRFTMMILSAPGFLVLVRKRPCYALATVLALFASVFTFARYIYEGDRFHWPALVLMVPALAISLELAVRPFPMRAAQKAALMSSVIVGFSYALPVWLNSHAESDWRKYIAVVGAVVFAFVMTLVLSRWVPRSLAAAIASTVVWMAPVRDALGGALDWLSSVKPLATGAIICVAVLLLTRVALLCVRQGQRSGIAGVQRVLVAVAIFFIVIGGVQRVLAAHAPFRIASKSNIDRVHVFLNQIPCDFLAWEHLSWECSHFDEGVYSLVGLVSSAGIQVQGHRVPMMLIPSGRNGEVRKVIWNDVEAREVFKAHWAIPDGLVGRGVARLFINDEQVFEFVLPERGDGSVHEITVPTKEFSGKKVQFRIEVLVTPPFDHRATLAIDGSWT